MGTHNECVEIQKSINEHSNLANMIFKPNATSDDFLLARNSMAEKISKGELDLIISTDKDCLGANFFRRCLVVVATPFKDWIDYI